MKAESYIAFLNSPEGMLLLGDAARLLRNASPEEDDLDLVKRVVALGFPEWAAVRLFREVTRRYAPKICKACGLRFTPRSPFTASSRYCHPCRVGPRTAQQVKQIRAAQLAGKAARKGKIRWKPCAKCGSEDPEMHHPDYDRPLHVIWLCRVCHRAEHKEINVHRGTSNANA